MTGAPLKLLALDAEDLAVVSAHLQDAVLKASDMAYLARERRFVLVCSRFDWAAVDGGACQRRRTGMRFEQVSAVRARGIPKGGDAALELLAIRFAPELEPAGTIELVFAGGAGLRLTVECIEAALDDLSPAWQAETVPGHD
ncbi:DUF2948 family protein [Phreatobacter sp.]|uniref:DUF2948 family protein n=1 Tax=Phreatobacter sp. TaxID=1966341 RepID=UPI003F721B52